MHYYLQAALARERHRTLLAEAEEFRLAKRARTNQPTTRDTITTRRRWRPRWVLLHRAVPSTETPT